MNEPLVSVVLPTLDRPVLLGRAIRSALAQTFRDFELIVVDDGSAPETRAVVESFEDERVRYARQERRGAAAAENLGIAMARGRYVAFLDDDDEWLPEKLGAQVARFGREPAETAVVYTGRIVNRYGRRTYGPSRSTAKNSGMIHREILSRRVVVSLVSAMVRKECLEEIGGFDESLPTSNDYDLWIRLSERYAFAYLPEPLVSVNYTPGSLSTFPPKILAARKMLIEKHAERFRRLTPQTEIFFRFQIGSMLLLGGHDVEGRAYVKSAFLRAPWRPTYAAALAFSLLGSERYVRWFFSPLHRSRHLVNALRSTLAFRRAERSR